MLTERKKIKIDTNKNKVHNIQYSNSYITIKKIWFLQIINVFFILLLILYFTLYKNNNIIISNRDKNYNFKNNSIDILNNKIGLLKMMTNNVELEYKGKLNCLLNNPDSEFCIYHLIAPKKVVGKNRILLGDKSDGCYVLLDDFDNIKIAYSFGISTNIQFDKALADKGIDVFMYDHTINSLPYQNPKFHWKKLGLCGKKTYNTNLKNLESLIKENGHTNAENMILKMDIEKWEWESLIDLNEETLNQFKYIAIEYHFFDEKNIENKYLYYNVLKKISKTHQPFYVRCNNDRGYVVNFGNNRICYNLEVSYIIRKGNKFIKDDTIYPIYDKFEYIQPQLNKLEVNLNILHLFVD